MKVLGRQLILFFICGLTSFSVDAFLYHTLLPMVMIPTAKGFSFIGGTVTSFTLNKYITFRQKQFSSEEIIRFAALYACTLCLNIGINQLGIHLFNGRLPSAFLLATAITAIVNFIGQRGWVFKQQNLREG